MMSPTTESIASEARAAEARIDRVLAAARQPIHDVADRRENNMDRAIAALRGCVADLNEFSDYPGLVLLVADRVERLMAELEGFKARDLLNLRKLTADV